MADQAFAGLVEATGGSFSYAGHNFDGAYNIKTLIEYIYDDADREVVAHKLTITVVGVLQNDNLVDDDVQIVRDKLSTPGKKLAIENKGLGDQMSLTPMGDVIWGPKPRFLQWEPVGDNLAVQITWQVELHISPCPTTGPNTRPLAFNFEADYSIDEHGDTTRTITGYLQIAQTRTGDNKIAKVADQWREQVNVGQLLGFSRTQNWSTNKDKNRLDFTITDKQNPSPNAYPAGMTAISGSHRVSWSRKSPVRQNGVISMTLTPAFGLSGAAAWAVFISIVDKRIQIIRQRLGPDNFIMLKSFSMVDNLFGRPAKFSVGYQVMGVIEDILVVVDPGRRHALWTPVGTNWNEWHVSLQDTAFSRRGSAELGLLPSDDALVNLCHGAPPVISAAPKDDVASTSPYKPLTNKCPPESTSWIAYDSRISISDDVPAQKQRYLQQPGSERAGGEDVNSAETTQSQYTTGPPQGFSDVIQIGGTPSYSIQLHGHAERACYRIPRPTIEKVGDRDVTYTGGNWTHHVKETLPGKFIVFEAWWDFWYELDNSPGEVNPPADKLNKIGEGDFELTPTS